MTTHNAQVSQTFPEGFGDFAVQSSDGVVCYFPSALLSFMSPIFHDMFSLGGDSAQRNETLTITESINILELYLTHINPKMNKPPIDKDTITELLEMAHKYQTDTIIEWFDQEATSHRTRLGDTVQERPFSIAEPIISLGLAVRYNLPLTGKYAFKEICELSMQRILPHASQLGFPVFLQIIKIQEERLKRYETWIDILGQYRLGHETWEDEKSIYIVDGVRHAACIGCIIMRVRWTTGITRAVQRVPSWASFIEAYESDSQHCFAWGNYFRDFIPGWKEQALKEESKHPDWRISGVNIQ